MRSGLLALTALFLALPAGARAGDADFKALVKGIETQYGVSRTRIPLFGLVKALVKVARPHGVKQFDLAVFEDARFGDAGENDFDAVVRKTVSGGWRPIVLVRSSAPREWTGVYLKEVGRDFRMMIATFEPSEAVVVQFKMNARRLMEMLKCPEQIGGRNGRTDAVHGSGCRSECGRNHGEGCR